MAATQIVSWGILYYAFSVLLVPMERSLGWSRTTLVGGFTVAVVVSGLAARAVGRALDADGSRRLMTGGSILAVTAVVAWSQTRSLAVYYLAFLAIGVAMACVLYDPAFTVLAKFTAPHHRRAITAVTLVAGLASITFQPLTSALATHLGWRRALVVLAVILAASTVPVHAAVLPPPRHRTNRAGRRRARPPEATEARFWVLTGAFVGVTTASMAMGVLLVAYLVDGGWSLGRAAVAAGTLGAMQLPGRVAFGPLADRVPRPALVAALFCLPAAGIAVLAVSDRHWPVWLAVTILGFGQGTTTLLRATLYVDLYGVERIGAINGLSGTPITCARALAPLGASVLVARTGSYGPVFAGLVACSAAAAAVAAVALRGGGDQRALEVLATN